MFEVTTLFDSDERRVRRDAEYGEFSEFDSLPRVDLADVIYPYRLSLELGAEERKKLNLMVAAALRANSPMNWSCVRTWR
jgi:hypothetical protein